MLSYVCSDLALTSSCLQLGFEDSFRFLRAFLCLPSVLKEFLDLCEQRWSHSAPLLCAPAMGRIINQMFSLRDGSIKQDYSVQRANNNFGEVRQNLCKNS